MKFSTLTSDSTLPLVVQPDGDPGLDSLVAWLGIDAVATLLHQHGALLLRDFSVAGEVDLECLVPVPALQRSPKPDA